MTWAVTEGVPLPPLLLPPLGHVISQSLNCPTHEVGMTITVTRASREAGRHSLGDTTMAAVGGRTSSPKFTRGSPDPQDLRVRPGWERSHSQSITLT